MNHRQLDAIREVANIGAGHAATALSGMTDLRVMISVPRVEWVARARAPGPSTGEPDRVVISVPVMGGDGEGRERAALILARGTALRMISLLLRRRATPSGANLGDLERSTLEELGNIVCASYVGVLGDFLRKRVMIGPPELTFGEQPELYAGLGDGLVIETDFTFQETHFEGVFLLHHSELAFATLLDALGVSELE